MTSDIQTIIKDKSSDLSPQLRMAAVYVADNPMEISYRPLRQIAKRAELAAPTFSRLAKKLGFSDYEALREACRRTARNRYLSYGRRAAMLRDEEVESAVPHSARFGMQSLQNLEKTILDIKDDLLVDITHTLLDARHVHVNAQMGLSHLGAYWVYVASLGFDNWARLGAQDNSVAAQLRGMGQDDAVICIAIAPYARQTIELARAAAQRGAEIICITDSPSSPLCELAHHSLMITDDSAHFFASQISLIYTIETIMGLMVTNSGPEVQDRLNRSESFSENSGEYLARGAIN